MKGTRFWVGFVAAILLIAGGVSYLASPHPDGLDSATLRGCEVTEVDGATELTGDCIAQHATEHQLAASPLADYTLLGNDGTSGIAGLLGAVVTFGIAFGLFSLLARNRRHPATAARNSSET
ncbi:PDGLE domain-containing protein [Mycolicibacterium brumae]|uniref:PDGLE domain-containing protein n=1 Tax=Mycolicibacterium brumae TaxID=85968 RepID=A0A2G5P567_9MYCO|nr:PDGLE domain-containing protein [Mycolicibacterium brumae]MCV7191699.1 PDGLE domain-containing protein [Mycolicibacterium brumae]PIB73508.1 hypothetical protein CQY22_016365 [Mycolicibacterium brumae]RWA20446.1 hypothetical protein MBRU_01980 [Mycolicibacterium brumae DSM 44177]UWW07546.1 PDGLE domain-containing protein [Mycolicibacterium brumae]